MGDEERQQEGETFLEWVLRQQRLENQRIKALEIEMEGVQARLQAIEQGGCRCGEL